MEKSPDHVELLFAEELGWVLQVDAHNTQTVLNALHSVHVPAFDVGVTSKTFGRAANVVIRNSSQTLICGPLTYWRKVWEETSRHLEFQQASEECILEEAQSSDAIIDGGYELSADLKAWLAGPNALELGTMGCFMDRIAKADVPSVAILREEGSNGDREMAAAFMLAGFDVHDVTVRDLLSGRATLAPFRGIAFVGGFSYADVLGSAKGWASGILFHSNLREQFDHFYQREDTFSLGICNGCQLMALLGWVANVGDESAPTHQQSGVYLAENTSGRFESRFSTVKVEESPSIMLKDMVGSVLGIWVQNGEGRFYFRSKELQDSIVAGGLVPLVYASETGDAPATTYPANPSGSPESIAGLCSPDGRHLALMPHPERCFLSWQWPYCPPALPNTSIMDIPVSPWLRMFKSAFDWCSAE